MKKAIKIGITILFISFIYSCNNSDKNQVVLKQKKEQLQKLKSQKEDLDTKIISLEKEIAKLDTSAVIEAKPKLVALSTIEKRRF